MNENRRPGLGRAARLSAGLALALAVTGCGGRAPGTVEPAPTARLIVTTATPDLGTTLESPLGTTFVSPLGTTLESPLATPTPAAQSQDRGAMEEAIAAVMLDMIVRQDLDGTVASVGEVAAADVVPEDDLIVWTTASPAIAAGKDRAPFERLPKLDETAPMRVWVNREGGQATIGGDASARAEAIRAYRAATVEADATQDIVTWGLYEFGIVALDEAAGQATVYNEASCGRLCASATLYILRRGADGAWSVLETSPLFIA